MIAIVQYPGPDVSQVANFVSTYESTLKMTQVFISTIESVSSPILIEDSYIHNCHMYPDVS